MAIWIQSLSWTLIYSIGQGLLIYALLALAFKLMPGTSASARYRLSLSALAILLTWFAATWWQQYHSIDSTRQLMAPDGNTTILWPSAQYAASVTELTKVQSLQSLIGLIAPWLSACYVAGLILMLSRFSAGALQLVSLKRKGTSEPDAALHELLHKLQKQVQVIGPVQLLISARAQVPMVIGFLKPVILMPAAAIAQLDSKQLETILLHELAHIKRHDYLINILQTIVETILFFNPFVWMIASITRREREHCCDDLVVGNTHEPLNYATALSILASWRPQSPSMAVAASGRSNQLYNRIQRIMEMKHPSFSYSRTIATILIVAIITCSIAWVKPTFTKSKSRKATAAKTAPKTAESETVNKVTAVVNDDNNAKDNTAKTITIPKPVDKNPAPAAMQEENLLVQRLLEDRLIDQVKGFVVEKRMDKLFINGQLQTDEVANKYLPTIKKPYMRMKVFSLEQRLRMHPNANFIQVILPFTLESECVDKQSSDKEGC